MIDTHCHLTDRRLFPQLDDVLRRATLAGVTRLITIATTLDDSRNCIAICKGRDNVRCTVGIHPHEAAEAPSDYTTQLHDLQSDPTVLAIGEIGLDYHYDFSPRPRQREVFEAQLQIAAQTGRKIVIHCREAIDDCLAILANHRDIPAVFHSFTGTVPEARRILDAGYLLGFTGIVTFKNSDTLRDVARLTPLDRILLETDAPYLAPEPFRRQKVNEPALVIHTAARIAEVKGLDAAHIDDLTTENARRFFGWPA